MEEKLTKEVDGYIFSDPDVAAQASKEFEGIRYMKQKLNMDQPLEVLSVYNRILREKMFSTPVGYDFLRELQEYLYNSPSIPKEEIHPIDFKPVEKRVTETIRNELALKYKARANTLLIINIALVIVILAMILIMQKSDTPTIVNYENKLIDKYETWQTELEEREERVREYEEKYHLN